MDNFLTLENRRNGEILRMHRRRDAEGGIVLYIDGTLPPKADGPPLHVHVREREEGIVKAGTLGARVGGEKIVVANWGRRRLAHRRSSSLVERGRRSVGV